MYSAFLCFVFLTYSLIAIGQALNGVATSIMNTVPTVASKTWFLATERTTATAVSELSCAVGAAAAFLFGDNYFFYVLSDDKMRRGFKTVFVFSGIKKIFIKKYASPLKATDY